MPAVDRDRVTAALPGYTVGRELGADVFGLVLASHHHDLDRDAAIKIFSLAADDNDPGAVTDFVAQAQLLSRLDHPHIVRIYDYVGRDDLCLLIMELLAGGTLTGQHLPGEGACALGLAVADALTCAHTMGILHRDIKPDNILFTAAGQPKITDFGIAKILDGSADTASRIVGTPKYMAPEQITGDRLGPATDLYALGVVLYELLAGTPPFDPRLPLPELFRHHCELTPPPPAGAPAPVAEVVMRALAKEPADRYPSAHAFALDLSHAATRVYGPHWIARSGIILHITDELRDPAAHQAAREAAASQAPGETTTTTTGPPASPSPPPAGRTATARLNPPGTTPPPAPAPPPGTTTPRPTATPGTPAGSTAHRRKRLRRVPVVLLVAVMALGVGTLVTWTLRDRSSAPPSTLRPTSPPTATAIPVDTGVGASRGNGPADGSVGQPDIDRSDDIVVDRGGNIYIAESTNNRIRRIDTRGTITTVAGTGAPGSSGDGGPATRAALESPSGVTVDAAGNLYIIDGGNNRIRRVDTSGVITTIAGAGGSISSGDNGPARQANLNFFNDDIVVDTAGNLYISEFNRVRRIDTNGIITTIAGTRDEGFAGDGGPANKAKTGNIGGLAVDAAGNLYIADQTNHRIRRIDTSGIITTIAGTGTQGFSGDGGPARRAKLDLLGFGGSGCDMAVDGAGNLYITDELNERIRRVDTNGIITTFAGIGVSGLDGNGGPATRARLAGPNSVEVDAAGNVYIGELGNSRIRKVDTRGIITTPAG